MHLELRVPFQQPSLGGVAYFDFMPSKEDFPLLKFLILSQRMYLSRTPQPTLLILLRLKKIYISYFLWGEDKF
jgi:hypothetical protein